MGKLTDKDSLMVSIRCFTYNHEKYIRDALEGFVMQKTNFRFEAIVHDDASTDGTAAIIREYEKKYPDIIKPIYETVNQYSKHDGSLRRIMNAACKGKYVAWCEGDDFWTDPYKLQKQVDILEANPDVSFVYTSFHNVDEKGVYIERPYFDLLMKRSHSGYLFSELYLNGNFIMTVTTCARIEVTQNEILINSPVSLDYFTFLIAAYMGKAYYLPDKTACYRYSPHGMNISRHEEVNAKILKIKKYVTRLILTGKIKPQSSTNNYKLYVKCLMQMWRIFKIDIKSLINTLN